MSSFLCFICHSTVNADTNEDMREKYREVVGMHLCADSHLCHICCHVLNKLSLFRAVCLKRSLEYPVLFSEKGTLNLQRNDLEFLTVCPEDSCGQYHRNINSKTYSFHCQSDSFDNLHCQNGQFEQFDRFDHQNEFINNRNQYVELREENINEYFSIDRFGKENLNRDTGQQDNMAKDISEDYSDSDSFVDKGSIDENHETINEVDSSQADFGNCQITHESCLQRQAYESLPEEEKQNPSFAAQSVQNCMNATGNVIEEANDACFSHSVQNETKTYGQCEFKTYNNMVTHVPTVHGPPEWQEGYTPHTAAQSVLVDKTQDMDTPTNHNTKEIGSETNPDIKIEETELSSTKEEVMDQNAEENKRTEEKNPNKKRRTKKRDFTKITLNLEQQKAELEAKRKEKKYLGAEFKCFNCALGFLFKDTYQAHMMRHEESNGEHKCPICTLRFASPAVLRVHRAGHAQRHRCARCGHVARGTGRATHARKCRARSEAACHLCGQTFRDRSGLQQHLKRRHRAATPRRIPCVCHVCGSACADQAAVRTHMIKHINRKFPCDTCPSTFSSPYTLNQHKKKHTTPGELHYCVSCNIGYPSRKSLLAHRRNALAHQETVVECPICGRSCPNQRSLASHITSVHFTTKSHACPHCPNRYSNRKSLVRHIGSHERKKEVRKAVCHLCGRCFKGTNKLNRHLREVCEKAKLEEEIALLLNQGCMDAG